MKNLSPGRLLTRAGTGAAVIALVAITGYSVGQTQSQQALVSAATTPKTRSRSQPR